ncbi:hypothetical protein H4W31_006398 [Plantactinospora soyae]|uniref:Uncharacterized protein n=1 Tax=Plantactinospora soyae TaxID=1544732 RepID=A0A927MBW5_9ACTN|nr:hypothetical protein [Plantactinospora soyae]
MPQLNRRRAPPAPHDCHPKEAALGTTYRSAADRIQPGPLLYPPQPRTCRLRRSGAATPTTYLKVNFNVRCQP